MEKRIPRILLAAGASGSGKSGGSGIPADR